MGALFAGKCFATSSEAADAMFSALPPSYTSGSPSYNSHYTNDSGVWKIAYQSINDSGIVIAQGSTIAPIPSFLPCSPLDSLADGQAVGWGLALCIIGAWCIRTLYRGI